MSHKQFLHHVSGCGSVLNVKGDVEMDAIVMDGKTLASGAVSAVRNIANPVQLARLVMDKVIYHEIIPFLNNASHSTADAGRMRMFAAWGTSMPNLENKSNKTLMLQFVSTVPVNQSAAVIIDRDV